MRISLNIDRSFLVVTGILAVMGTTACSPTGADSTQPPSQAPTPPSKSAPSSIEVENPKNLKSVTDPCSLLSREQLAKLGMDAEPTREKSALGAQSCDWSGDEFAMTLTPDTVSGGIGDLYRENKSSSSFKRVSVEGYPGAWVDKTTILCRVEVGVSNNAMVSVDFASNATSDEVANGQIKPCKRAEEIAAMALKNIPDA